MLFRDTYLFANIIKSSRKMIINATCKIVITSWGGRELGRGRSSKRAFRRTGLRF